MKTFLEWAKDNHLFNELSPELLMRAADAATSQYDLNRKDKISGVRSGAYNPQQGEGGRNFKQAAMDRYQFPITLKTSGGNIFELPIKWITPGDFTGEYKLQTDGKGVMILDLANHRILDSAGHGYGIEQASVREILKRIQKINQESGNNIAYTVRDFPVFKAATAPSPTRGQPAQNMNVQGGPSPVSGVEAQTGG